MMIGDQNRLWTPHVVYYTCRSNLKGWMRGNCHSVSFLIPQIWKFKKMTNLLKFTYLDIPYIASLMHSEELFVLRQPSKELKSEGEDFRFECT